MEFWIFIIVINLFNLFIFINGFDGLLILILSFLVSTTIINLLRKFIKVDELEEDED